MQQLLCIESIEHLHFWDLLLLFKFLSSLEKQYMNHQVKNLPYDTCNAVDELIQK